MRLSKNLTKPTDIRGAALLLDFALAGLGFFNAVLDLLRRIF